jgi:hypothetical protein
MLLRFLPILACALFVNAGCNVINPADPVPTYVRIDSFQFVNPNPTTTVGSTNSIRSVFVSFAGKTIGTFDLPASIPIIANAPGQLQVSPGVDNSGLVSYQILYPHYMADTMTLAPAPGKEIAFTPKTGYPSASTFTYREDFENSNDFTTVTGANFETNAATPIAGVRSGQFRLLSADAFGTAVSSTAFSAGSKDPFIELDYKTINSNLGVGLYSATTKASKYIVTLTPNSKGGKVYISLTGTLGTLGTNGTYYILLSGSTAEGQSSGSVLVDNIKVVTF